MNEKKVASGSGEKALGDPINVMVWLANQQRRRGGLRAGSVVSTERVPASLGLNRETISDFLAE